VVAVFLVEVLEREVPFNADVGEPEKFEKYVDPLEPEKPQTHT
jgi:hypothetical protein